MKTLLLLRHAKSSRKHPELLDHDRPLNKRGLQAAPVMGALLLAQDLVPDLIVCSTATRAHATARLVAKACRYAGEIRSLARLYLAEPADYREVLRSVADQHRRVLVVGHNPGLEELVEALTGAALTLPTAALVPVDLPVQHWRDLTDAPAGRRVNTWLPRQLGSDGPAR